jgi:citrate lyase subunit beta/citryl-CoA lyase
MTTEIRAARSWLFVPGDSERKIARCWESGADALIFDLEDSVSAEAKPAARALVAETLPGRKPDPDAPLCVIRINAFATGLAQKDIEETISGRPAAYVVPKVGSAADVVAIAEILESHEARMGILPGNTRIIPIATETPGAIFRLSEIAEAHPRNAALMWGMEDLAVELAARATRTATGEMLDVFKTVRSLALLAGAAAGIGIIDTPMTDIGALDRLEDEALDAARMGFTGKLAIHPSQVEPINRAFTPSDEEIADAREILRLSLEGGGSAFRFKGRMIDTPHLVAAERLLAKTRR